MPGHHSSGLDEVDGAFPFRPQAPQTEPEEAVTISELGLLRLALEDGELVAEREVLERETAASLDR